MKISIILLFFSLFLHAASDGDSNSIDFAQLYNSDKLKKEIISSDILKKEIGISDTISLDNFSLSEFKEIKSLGDIPSIDGIQNLEYLNTLKNTNINNLNPSQFKNFNLSDFSFNADKLNSLGSIEGFNQSLGGSGETAKEKAQTLILLNGQIAQQLSGQTFKHIIMKSLDPLEILAIKEYLYLLKKDNLIIREQQ